MRVFHQVKPETPHPRDWGARKWKMTKRREEILEFIRDFIAANGYAPSNKEIRIGTGLSSSSAVCMHLNALKFLGKISFEKGLFRSITIVDKDADQLACQRLVEALNGNFDLSDEVEFAYLREVLERAGLRVVLA